MVAGRVCRYNLQDRAMALGQIMACRVWCTDNFEIFHDLIWNGLLT